MTLQQQLTAIMQPHAEELKTILEQPNGFKALFMFMSEFAKDTTIQPKSNKKITKKAAAQERKRQREAKAQELVQKIKETHDIDIDPNDYTQKAMKTILRTGKLEPKRKQKGHVTNNYMNFLANRRQANKNSDDIRPDKEVRDAATQEWRAMSKEEKNEWVTKQDQVEENKPQEQNEVEENKPQEQNEVEENNTQDQVEENNTQEVKQVSKPTKSFAKMKKQELTTYLEETYGWDINKKCTVKQLRQAAADGVCPEPVAKKKKTTQITMSL